MNVLILRVSLTTYITTNPALQAPPAFIIGAATANMSDNSGKISEIFDGYYGDHNGFFGLAFGLVSLLGPFGYGRERDFLKRFSKNLFHVEYLADLKSVYTVRHPLSCDVLFCWKFRLPMRLHSSCSISPQPLAGRWNMSKMPDKISRLRG